MKKLITSLSALTITSAIAPTVVACKEEKEKEKEKGWNLNSLNADSFKILQDWESNEPGVKPKLKETKIEDIKDDKEMENAIRAHINMTIGKEIFDLKDFDPESESDRIKYVLSLLFIGPFKLTILKINVNTITSTKKYEITIEKTKWDDIKDKVQDGIKEAFEHDDKKLAEKVSVEKLKSYYDLIKGEKVTITLEINK